MLTPVDVQNKIFKGGIGFDKKEVESFMREIASDYENLYRSNVELKDKVATLNESLQHYRSIEDSMQKALTLSEKTAEETVNAANDKGRQIMTEAEKKAESILEDAQKELTETKNEIYKLQQQYAKFKKQYTRILYMQLKSLGEEVVDIDLGEDFEADATYEESNLRDGLSGLGAAGGYTGSSSMDDRFERTNQESAFGNMGSLNMDPFSDAANGGGRFSKKSSKTFSGNSKKKNANSTTNTVKSHGDKKKSEPVKESKDLNEAKIEQDINTVAAVASNVEQNVSATVSVEPKAEQNVSATVSVEPKAEQNVSATVSVEPKAEQNVSATVSVEPKIVQDIDVTSSITEKEEQGKMDTTVSESKETMDAVSSDNVIRFDSSNLNDEKVISGEVEEPIMKSNMIGNSDDDSEGFNFIQDVAEVEEKVELNMVSDNVSEAITGEVEDRINEATMLDSQDNYDEGFDFINNNDTKETIISDTDISELDENTYVGEVEDRVNESTMLESEDNMNEGFDFLVGNEDEEDDIPTIFPNLHTIKVPSTGTWEGALEEEASEEEEEEVKFV